MKFKQVFIAEGLTYLFKKSNYYFTMDSSKASKFIKDGGEEIGRKEWNEAKSDYKAMNGNVKDFSTEL